MTSTQQSQPRVAWYLRPGIVLPSAGAIVAIAALLAPERRLTGRNGDPRLTTYSTDPMGGRVFYELADRLGWQVEPRRTPDPPPGADVIHAVLAAEIAFRREEVHAVLERVRNGAALLLVIDNGSDRFGDSLRVQRGPSGEAPAPDTIATPCPTRRIPTASIWFGSSAFLSSIRWRDGPPTDLVTLVSVTPAVSPRAPRQVRTPVPALAGYGYGRGRIVVATDPDVFRNDALRVCQVGLDVPAVRALEYLRDGGDHPRTRIVFDEFHHDLGQQPGSVRTITSYLAQTSSGHVFAQLCAAGLVLLAAMAPRAVPPRHVTRVERRSPFEHVDALARAYAQVGATRTATSRLLRGVRRRVQRGALRAPRELPDDAFLDRVAHLAPTLAADVPLIRRALAAPVASRDFARVGEAIDRLEHNLLRI